ncbi:thiamine phosphate synthase [bacterium]|nr:thiamine phosphate synthase [bacterium]
MNKLNLNLHKMGFYFVTDCNLSKIGVEEDVKAVIKAGVKIVQYREKNKSSREMFKEALILKKICNNKTLLIINDRIDIALAVDADGVHLGQDDIPCQEARVLMGKDAIIGVTVHNIKEAVEAEKCGADYVGASPIFTTFTKKDAGEQAGLQLIKDLKSQIKTPIVAIGGIDLKNGLSVMEAGADSFCAISAVISEGKTFEESKKFVQLVNRFTC